MNGLVRNALVVGGVLTLASAASAGNGTIPGPVCYRNPDSSGSCYGFYKGFRNGGGTADYASFRKAMYSNGYIDLSFVASIGTSPNVQNYYCSAPAGSFFAKQTDVLVGNYFVVSWDSSGACTYIFVANNSVAY